MPESQSLPHDWFPRPLPENVQIGPHSWVYSSFAFLHYHSRRECGVRIGHDTGIYNGTFFDLDVDGEVDIGNYCTLVGAIVATNGRVSIGDYTFIAHEVTIADHFAAAPPGSPMTSPARNRTGEIVIGPNVWIGACAVVLGAQKSAKRDRWSCIGRHRQSPTIFSSCRKPEPNPNAPKRQCVNLRPLMSRSHRTRARKQLEPVRETVD